MRRAAAWVVGAAVVVGTSGCAERRLVTQPETPPTGTTWAVVAVAGALAALVTGALLTLPAWRARTGARLAVAVLSAYAGGVLVGGAVLLGTAVRSWQLLDHPVEAAAEPALLRLSAIDGGDTGFFALMALVVVVLTALTALLLTLAARWAATDRLLGRSIASAVLALLTLVGVASVGMVVLGSTAWPYVLLAAGTPVTAAALRDAWPARRTA
jgi:hypothetical protein